MSDFISSLSSPFPYPSYLWSLVLQIFTEHLYSGPLLGTVDKVIGKTNPDLFSTLTELPFILDTHQKKGHKMVHEF